jgi:hypothetical protein
MAIGMGAGLGKGALLHPHRPPCRTLGLLWCHATMPPGDGPIESLGSCNIHAVSNF